MTSLFVVNGFSHVLSSGARNSPKGLNYKLDRLLFCSLFCCVQLSAVTPPVITTFDDLDQRVEEGYVDLTNSFSIFPPGNGVYEVSRGCCLFSSGSEIETATNLFHFSPCMGVPAWTIRIVETQDVDRVWFYQGFNDSVFRTNSVPMDFNAEQWVEDVYGDVPGWLGASEENEWYVQRDRSRVAIVLYVD